MPTVDGSRTVHVNSEPIGDQGNDGPLNVEHPDVGRIRITQWELQLFLSDKDWAKKFEVKTKRRGIAILSALEAGAEVEPGSLSARVETRTERELTEASMLDAFGEAHVEDVKQQLPVTLTQTLRVG